MLPSPPGLFMAICKPSRVVRRSIWPIRAMCCHLEAVLNQRPSSKAEGDNTKNSMSSDIPDAWTALQENVWSGEPSTSQPREAPR